jgi:hypothetical protein
LNKTSQQGVERAKSVARIYANHPDVQVIILGGSTARGVANENSDIDLGLFWTQIASVRERDDLMRQAGGQLNRRVENHLRYSHGNPRTDGCIEIIDLRSTADRPRLRLDLEHETVAGTEQVLLQVLDDGDLSLEKQELLSVIQTGIVLHCPDVVDHWQEKAKKYPDELAYKMVTEHISGIGESLIEQVHWVSTQDWFYLYEGFLNIERRLLLTLMGLNRVWAFTDNPDFKGLKLFVDELELKPDDFVDQLGQVLQSDASAGIRGLVALSEEVLELIDVHMPTVDTHSEREMLGKVIHKINFHI